MSGRLLEKARKKKISPFNQWYKHSFLRLLIATNPFEKEMKIARGKQNKGLRNNTCRQQLSYQMLALEL